MARRSRGFTRIRWFRRNVAWGTVYLTCDEEDPRRIKIGFTQRKTVDRRKELSRSVQGRMVIVQTVKMPHAFALEARCHAKIGRLAGRDRTRNREWYILREGASVSDVAQLITEQATRLRRIARLKIAWPSYGRITLFDSGWRPAGRTDPIKSDLV
ncbi:GIY-YIG nuclease family protein [Paracoccus sp. FO-3]|uniref:GIY-YIG nuclease family protein n=1 Tax=Paracoccus sp. FO-3 TaxID=1335059 RepID=UPI00112A5380|nr:GIY-YIG nuclease family protein [Paracoccus sp. FO-3]